MYCWTRKWHFGSNNFNSFESASDPHCRGLMISLSALVVCKILEHVIQKPANVALLALIQPGIHSSDNF